MGVLIDLLQDEFLRELYQKGRTEGRVEGRTEGRLEGEAAFLLKVLEQRFGALPTWVQEKVTAANEERLSDWNERVLQARSLEELLGRP